MARGPSKSAGGKHVETLTHDKAARRNIPTAEYQSVAERLEEQKPSEPAHYPRATPLPEGATRERDEDLDPQIVWHGARIRLTQGAGATAARNGRGRDRRRAAGLARQGQAGLVRPRRPRRRRSTSRRRSTPRRSSTI